LLSRNRAAGLPSTQAQLFELAMSAREFDPGPPARFATLFADCPPPTDFREHFWFEWGPVFYRGRLNGSARVLGIASDPGPTERVVGRTLIGDAGQRVQGFLAKIGLDRSYVLANAFPYSFVPNHRKAARTILTDPDQCRWRNRLYDALAGPGLQAIVAFGEYAGIAVNEWTTAPSVPIHRIPHPTSPLVTRLLDAWRPAVAELRSQVTPDADAPVGLPNYGSTFGESDYAAIPRRDLPFGVPAFVGNDAWVRAAGGHTSVSRPDPLTIEWVCPSP
jgi:uracil-DNA glycosylase